jgi:hypothetical protein
MDEVVNRTVENLKKDDSLDSLRANFTEARINTEYQVLARLLLYRLLKRRNPEMTNTDFLKIQLGAGRVRS